MGNFTVRTFSSDQDLVAERRVQLIRCFTRVFIKKGYNSTNMRQLSEACKISIGSIYYYFGSKDEILYSIIHTATVQHVLSIEKFANSLDNLKPTEALMRLLEMFYQWHQDNQHITLFAYQETKNLPRNARRQVLEWEGRILNIFERLIIKGVESGEFNTCNTKLMAHNILIGAHMWAFRGWCLRDQWTFEEYRTNQTNMILKALKPMP